MTDVRTLFDCTTTSCVTLCTNIEDHCQVSRRRLLYPCVCAKLSWLLQPLLSVQTLHKAVSLGSKI